MRTSLHPDLNQTLRMSEMEARHEVGAFDGIEF